MPEWMLKYEEPVLVLQEGENRVEWCELLFRFPADTAEGAHETVRLFVKEPRIELGQEKYFRRQVDLQETHSP